MFKIKDFHSLSQIGQLSWALLQLKNRLCSQDNLNNSPHFLKETEAMVRTDLEQASRWNQDLKWS